MIESGLVRDALLRCLGAALAEDASLVRGVAGVLEGYRPVRDTFAGLTKAMEEYLFNALYERLGPGMSFRGDDGARRRVLLSDLPLLADQMLFPLFASMKPWSVDYERLRTWFMESGSWAALFALLLVFQDFLAAQERLILERAVRENVPAALWPADLCALLMPGPEGSWQEGRCQKNKKDG